MRLSRKLCAMFAFSAFTALLLRAFGLVQAVAGVSSTYNSWGYTVAPNMVTAILFDFRGYDTLGECIILVAGVLALSIVYGRGRIGGDVHEDKLVEVRSTSLLGYFAKTIAPFVVALGVYVTLGGHITPGGGFPGGSIIAAGLFMAVVLAGNKAFNMSHDTMIKMESLGILLYIGLGLAGLLFGGFFLYNVGVDGLDTVSSSVVNTFNYPDGVDSGIVPYLNIAVMLKVAAGLTTALLIIYGGSKDGA